MEEDSEEGDVELDCMLIRRQDVAAGNLSNLKTIIIDAFIR